MPMHSYMPCRIVFDVKIYFTRKDSYVDTGCHAPKSNKIHCVGVVSRNIVCIDFNYTYINGILI